MSRAAVSGATRAAGLRTPLPPGAPAVKATYFLSSGAMAALVPFAALYYDSLGLDAGRIGVLTGLPLLMTIVATPLWGALADARHSQRGVLVAAIVVAAAVAALVPAVDRPAVLLAVVVLQAAAGSPVLALVDSTALAVLAGREREYGRLRVWATAGWGASALVVGWIVGRYGPAWIYAAYVALMLGTLLAALAVPPGTRPARSGSFRRDAVRLLRDRRLWPFLAVVLLSGAGNSMYAAFLPLDLEGMGARDAVGAAQVVATTSEVPFMLLTGLALRRIGVARVLVLGAALYGVRALVLSFAHATWQVLLVQVLHGPTFALMWVAGVTLARRLAPPGLVATSQALYAATWLGLGGALGSVVGGRIFDSLGAAATFRAAALVLGVGVPVLALASGRRLSAAGPVPPGDDG